MTATVKNKSSSQRVVRSLHAHLSIAIALGGLIYILAITGTVAVFNGELQRWEQPSAPEMLSISPESAALAAKTVFEREEVATTHLYINFPRPDLPRTIITTDTQAFFANADGSVAGKEHFPWTQFLLDLHYYLHLPHILGLTVVGALGAFLLAMSLSGFMAHPRIFRDAFTFRRGAGLLPMVDLHNRLSVWTSPFHISNALTGALLGLASILAFSIAAFNFDGDLDKVFSPVFGAEPAEIEGKAPIADIAGPLRYMADEFPEQPLTYFILHDPATAGQHINVIATHTDRLIFGDYYNFDAHGEYQGNIGISDGTIGQQLIGSVYNIHFGNWGGSLVKIAYAIFGVLLSVIIASGLRIYFLRRTQKGWPATRLESAWEAVVWGTPMVLAATLLCAVTGHLDGIALVVVFWLGLSTTIIGAAFSANAQIVRYRLRAVTSAFLLIAVGIHAFINGNSLFTVAAYPVSIVLTGLAIVVFVPLVLQSKSIEGIDELATEGT